MPLKCWQLLESFRDYDDFVGLCADSGEQGWAGVDDAVDLTCPHPPV